ncbi:hypothetical protein C8R46DRAFT_1365218 [Mycena filopes]|nr:hypothetical protein C8R46DRAFT_1365218 [Mycena filopes]
MGRTTTPTTPVVISAETVVELSRNALLVSTIRCDAPISIPQEDGTERRGTCGQEIGSWKMFFRHQLKKHCRITKQKTTRKRVYECRLSKCSAHTHENLDVLRTHIESSHMKQHSFPCPFANCRPLVPEFGRAAPVNMFFKKQDLVAHLQLNHSDLIGHTLDPRSPRLLASWEPRPPARPLPAPPDLPKEPILSMSLRLPDPPPAIPSGWFARIDANGASSSKLAPPPTPTPTPFPGTPKTPTNRTGAARGLLRASSTLNLIRSSSPEHDGPEYEFEKLEPVYYDEATNSMSRPEVLSAPYFLVQPLGGTPAPAAGSPPLDMVRAPPLWQVPVPEAPPPPTSIFHEALRIKVFGEYARGQDDTAAAHVQVQVD